MLFLQEYGELGDALALTQGILVEAIVSWNVSVYT